jgi:hypothetical protein
MYFTEVFYFVLAVDLWVNLIHSTKMEWTIDIYCELAMVFMALNGIHLWREIFGDSALARMGTVNCTCFVFKWFLDYLAGTFIHYLNLYVVFGKKCNQQEVLKNKLGSYMNMKE